MSLNTTQNPYRKREHGRKGPDFRVPDSEVLRDLARGRMDPAFFAERWLGISGHDGQREWWAAMAARDGSGWRPLYTDTRVTAGNRAGKTLGLDVGVLHSTFYKLGVRPPKQGDREDALRWMRAPYEWYHVAFQQSIAELVHKDIVAIFNGAHPAQQGRGCPLVDTFGPKVLQWDKKYRGEYLWLQWAPYFGGGQVHFRTTQEKAKALLGVDMHGCSFDEAAMELYLPTIHGEVLNLRRLATGGQLHYISTATEGAVDFRDLWEQGNPENPDRDTRVFSLRFSTRQNIGYGIDADTFDRIVAQQPEYLIPQNIDGYFIEPRGAYFHGPSVDAAFVADLPGEEPPRRGHRYVQGVDPGISADATWGVVLDFSDPTAIRGVRAVRRAGRQQLPAVVNMVREQHLLYSQGGFCTTVVDSTGMGGKLFRQEFAVIRPLREFDFAGTKAKKLELLSDLKAALDRGRLRFPRGGAWDELRRQLLGYRLDDRKLTQDAVMALAIAVRYAIRNPTNAVADPVFAYFGG